MFLGSNTSKSASNSGQINPKLITTRDTLHTIWDKYYDELEKNEYESTDVYNQRINTFIADENNDSYIYRFDVEDWYDADTNTLYLYEINSKNDLSKEYYSFSPLDNTRLYVHGLSNYSFYIGHVEGACCYQDTAIIYKTLYITADEAQKLSNGFKIEIKLHLDQNLGIATRYYNSIYGGNFYDILGYANGVKIINTQNNKTYYEDNVSY